MKSNDPRIDGDRLWSDLMALAEITDPGKPYTRRSFSPLFLEGRAWLSKSFKAAGLDVRLDAAGNLIGRIEGQDAHAATIMIGSHSDTVPAGGRFDGAAGVIVALEIARAINEARYTPRHAIEVVDFLAEEPSEYGLSCVGSRAMAGRLSLDMLRYRDPSGEELGTAIARIGGSVERLGEAQRHDIRAFFELHIEQGRVLEEGKIALGVVTSIAGISRVEVVFEGQADHAGTTPMRLRRDAGLAAAELMLFVEARAQQLTAAGRGHFVATTGVVEIAPNAANVVPGRARLVVDIRAEDEGLGKDFISELDASSSDIAARRGVERKAFLLLSSNAPAPCSPELRLLLSNAARVLGYSSIEMASGAGHDASYISNIAPASMVFIPCREGRSHAPEEWAEPAAIRAGAATILEAVMRLDRGEQDQAAGVRDDV